MGSADQHDSVWNMFWRGRDLPHASAGGREQGPAEEEFGPGGVANQNLVWRQDHLETPSTTRPRLVSREVSGGRLGLPWRNFETLHLAGQDLALAPGDFHPRELAADDSEWPPTGRSRLRLAF